MHSKIDKKLLSKVAMLDKNTCVDVIIKYKNSGKKGGENLCGLRLNNNNNKN